MDKLIKAQSPNSYMDIKDIEGLRWPRSEKLRKAATNRTLTPNDLLALKSRSFYLPIWMLQLTRGNDETNKRPIITNLYNILREQDTIEDANPQKIDSQTKINTIDNFVYIINQLSRRNPSESIDDLVKNELAKLTKLLKTGVMDEDERVFVEHFGRGGVLESIRADATRPVKEAIFMCTTSMATGMKRFLENGKIDTMQKLDEYCSYVAGDVGTALNRIIEHSDKIKLDDNGAKIFGLSLQKTNVLKNIHEDWTKRGVLYLPKELLSDVANEKLFDMENSCGRSTRESALKEMILNTRKDLRTSLDYIVSIPESLTGYQGFAMIPFLAAIETLRAMESGGAEAVFSGKEDAIKMSQESFHNISRFTYSLMSLENGKRSKDFMTLYREDQDAKEHNKYCFDNKRFEKWTKELFK